MTKHFLCLSTCFFLLSHTIFAKNIGSSGDGYTFQNSDSTALLARSAYARATKFLKQKQTDSALVYVQRSIDLSEELNDSKTRGDNYLLLAKLKGLQKKHKDEVDLLLKQVLPSYSRIEDKAGLLNCFENLGTAYLAQKRYPQSLWFYSQQNMLAKELDSSKALSSSLLNIARLMIEKKEYALALGGLGQAKTLAQKERDFNKLIAIEQSYAKVYKLTGNKNLVAKALNIQEAMGDSLASDVAQIARDSALMKEQERQKASVAALLANKNKRAQADQTPLERPHYWTVALIALLAFGLTLGGIFYMNKRRKNNL